jgi:hypothetical protein
MHDPVASRRSLVRPALGIGVAVLLLGCQKSLPTAPSDLASGIVVYEHANYLGASAHITQDVKDLKDFKGPCVVSVGDDPEEVWNDCISSVRVAPGWRATLYRDDGFKGDQLQITEDTPNLQLVPGDCSKGGFNDCVTAIRIFRP